MKVSALLTAMLGLSSVAMGAASTPTAKDADGKYLCVLTQFVKGTETANASGTIDIYNDDDEVKVTIGDVTGWVAYADGEDANKRGIALGVERNGDTNYHSDAVTYQTTRVLRQWAAYDHDTKFLFECTSGGTAAR